jgi:hypothetical protein
MKHFRVLVIPACVVLLPACTDYATFVTSTDIGISADVNTQELHLGYVRTELFVGPGYPEYGAAPAAVGYLGSNLSVFSPKIKQLYATGDAAETVTQDQRQGADQQAMQIQSQAAALAAAAIRADNPQGPPPGTLAGQRRPLVFGTGSNIGVQLGFTGGTPSKVKFGYNREELSIIPFRAQTPTTQSPDKYAPVLAAIDMDLSTPNLPETELVLTQFFATGAAAQNLAKRDDIRGYFHAQAEHAVKQAAIVEARKMVTRRDTARDAIAAYLEKATDFAAARNELLARTALPMNDRIILELKKTGSKEAFMKYVTEHPAVIGPLANAIPANR